MVDDLLKLWNGVKIQIPSSNFSSKILRAALVYISSDLPATCKICGFLVLKQTMAVPSALNVSNYSGFNRDEWQSRTLDAHRQSSPSAVHHLCQFQESSHGVQ